MIEAILIGAGALVISAVTALIVLFGVTTLWSVIRDVWNGTSR